MKKVLTNIWKGALWIILALIARSLVIEANGYNYDSGLFVGLAWYFFYDRIFNPDKFPKMFRKKVAEKGSDTVSNA